MIDIILILFSVIILLLIFVRRWSILEKGFMFGKMVFKRGHNVAPKMTKEDHEVTVKEMIPEAESVDPKMAVKGDSFFKKAELELKKGNLEEAERLLIQAISMNPAHLDSHSKLGCLYMNQQSFGKAELIFRKLVIADSANPMFHSNLGLSLFHQEKFDEAKGFYEKSIEIDNTRAGRFFSLANINYILGDFDNAVLNIQKALSLDPDNLDYGLTLAHWYIEKELPGEARRLIEEILKHWPENEEALRMLAKLAEPAEADVSEEK